MSRLFFPRPLAWHSWLPGGCCPRFAQGKSEPPLRNIDFGRMVEDSEVIAVAHFVGQWDPAQKDHHVELDLARSVQGKPWKPGKYQVGYEAHPLGPQGPHRICRISRFHSAQNGAGDTQAYPSRKRTESTKAWSTSGGSTKNTVALSLQTWPPSTKSTASSRTERSPTQSRVHFTSQDKANPIGSRERTARRGFLRRVDRQGQGSGSDENAGISRLT